MTLQTYSEDAFYAWTYDRPASPYLWIGSVLIAVVVLGACCFPLAPYSVKLVVVYLSMGLLVTLVGALLVRGALAGVTWMAIGRSFWLLPNVLSEVYNLLTDCIHLSVRKKQLGRLKGLARFL